ncbi:MAG: LytTR family DNA-binding domain-containing protein [Dysgonamonadaceae bacterium]|jgi:two-component system LytT family response regulator|nr:LytTR family DNA-binding domain-containing protein [Dysgonamonadaceae bacterium]
MKAVIVEDEFVAAESLQRLLASIDENVEIVTVLQSVEDSVEWFSLNPVPDLVFMDIHLADGSSFSIFEKVKINCPIIFTTAYDEYSLKAFEVNSIDYLQKPINKKKLERAFEKLKSLSSINNNPDLLSDILKSLNQTKPNYKSHFLIPHKDKLIPLAIDQIAFIHSEYKMAKLVTFKQQTYTLDNSLEELSNQLDPKLFFRANRQYILSHQAISDMSVWFGGKLSVNLILPTPEKIIVSRARVSEFKNWYMLNSI